MDTSVHITIRLTRNAATMLGQCRQKEQKQLSAKIDDLETNPRLGKSLRDDLAGYFSIGAAGRYRVIYHLNEKKNKTTSVTVTVVVIGIRKEGDKNDAYVLAKKLKAQGRLLD